MAIASPEMLNEAPDFDEDFNHGISGQFPEGIDEPSIDATGSEILPLDGSLKIEPAFAIYMQQIKAPDNTTMSSYRSS